jgi:hypothetical protein
MLPTSFAGQKSDSPQTVLCNVTQLCARSKSLTRLMPLTRSAWPKIQVDQMGADESSDYGSGYLLNVAKASADLHGL